MSRVAILYSDGSYSKNYGIGAGAIIIDKETDKPIDYVSQAVEYTTIQKYNNVSGEVVALCYGIEKCIALGYTSVVCYVDYVGLVKWFDGSWFARNQLSNTYKRMLNIYKKKINIQIYKVKGHDGDYYNEVADRLAKKSIGVPF